MYVKRDNQLNMCPICHKNCQKFEVISKEFYHCLNCDFIFLDEKFIVSKEREKKRYSNHNNNIKNIGYVNMFRNFLRKISDKEFSNIKTALDYGCGPEPVLAELLKERGIKSDYYDPYFFPKIIFKDKKYDLITLTEVIEHVKDPVKLFNIFSSHIKPDGILAVMTQFHPKNKELFSKWWYIQDITHISFYSEKTIKIIAQKFGFTFLWSNEKDSIFFKKKFNNFL